MNHWILEHARKHPYCLTGGVLQGDVPNKNNRIYPLSLLEKLAADLQKAVKGRIFYGMMGFPAGDTIPYHEVSHVVTDLHVYDGWLNADIETIATRKGVELRKRIGAFERLALRPVGVGSYKINEAGQVVIGEDYVMTGICVIPADEAA